MQSHDDARLRARVYAHLRDRAGESCPIDEIASALDVEPSSIDADRRLSNRVDITRSMASSGVGDALTFWGVLPCAPEFVVPEVVFTPWTHWHNRSDLATPSTPHAGVYLLAYFTALPPDGPVKELPAEVVYVGETRNLNTRPLAGHNRVRRYREWIGDVDLQHLFVAVFRAFRTDQPEATAMRAFVEYVEGSLVWAYTQRFRMMPALHFKERTPRDPKTGSPS